MSKKLDFSEYQMNDYEKEKVRHRGNDSISFDVFQNKVVELKNEKSLCIYVDDFFENENIAHVYAEYEGYDNVDDYLEKYYQDLLKSVPDYYETEADEIKRQKAVIANYSEKFDVTCTYYEKLQKEALSSPLAGAVIKIPLGEGILDFCYADFEKQFEQNKISYSLFSDEMWNMIRKEKGLEPTCKISLIRNKNEELIEIHMRYQDAVSELKNIMELSIYSLINQPILINQNNKAYTRYKNYLLNLQDEMLNLLQFCYDETYYPKLLSGLTPAERFNIYSRVNRKQSSFERTEIFQLGTLLSAQNAPIKSDNLSESSQKINEFDNDSIANFAAEYDLDENFIKMLLAIPCYNIQYYECSTVYEILMLEFTKMLEHNIRFRKCKNCGRYFIMKGNYENDYCDRILEGETKNCQTIASLRNYKEKVSDNAAWKLYNKYYKRYFARMKAKNIDVDIFRKWQYKATSMRDQCVDGKVSEQTFEDFLFGSFVNRKKK